MTGHLSIHTSSCNAVGLRKVSKLVVLSLHQKIKYSQIYWLLISHDVSQLHTPSANVTFQEFSYASTVYVIRPGSARLTMYFQAEAVRTCRTWPAAWSFTVRVAVSFCSMLSCNCTVARAACTHT